MKTFLKPAELASVALSFVNLTVTVCYTGVDSLVLNCALEEAFAALAGDNAVVEARGLVLADHADHGLVVLLYHPVSWFMIITVEIRFTGLGVGWELFNVAFP